MKFFWSFIFAVFLAALTCNQTDAQTATSDLESAKILQIQEPLAIVIKHEITPGTIIFTRQNGCLVKIPASTYFLDNGITLKTPAMLTFSGNTIPQWRNEYRQPWMSKLTDYERGEYKMMLLQIGKHPSTLIKFEESEKQLLDSQTACAVAAYKIFGSNMRLLQEIPLQRQDSFALPLNQGWNKLFCN
ncbi:MAG: hypothetical protein HC836_04400 [Richelia sp. RM2_1_2]|nr:hypothetical protein [Richelia sp. SM1_7_0]NJN10470.1 hypothetical protein [Richelia sp. RM1_1_1]NJO57630.1 hypothetical protein [Richelia sp. RM2_1_2]